LQHWCRRQARFQIKEIAILSLRGCCVQPQSAGSRALGARPLNPFDQLRTISMNTKLKLTLALLAGVALGVTAIQGLEAQTKPLAYIVADVEVTDPAGYQTYVDRNTPIVAAAGGRFITRGEKIVPLDGPAPKRFAIIAFDSMEQAQAYRASAAYKDTIAIRDKSSKYHSFIAEGSVSSVVGK
jgi:uncharacterized protein (DUF1330 family)